VCAKSENQPIENRDSVSLRACLVDGDVDQLRRYRQTRRRSLLLSVLLQIATLAALILLPLLSKTPRIALANVMPVLHTVTPLRRTRHPASSPHFSHSPIFVLHHMFTGSDRLSHAVH